MSYLISGSIYNKKGYQNPIIDKQQIANDER